MGKYLRDIFQSNYLEEHLRTAAFEMTLWSDSLELCFWIACKTIVTQYYHKNTIRLQTKTLNKIWRVCRLYI